MKGIRIVLAILFAISLYACSKVKGPANGKSVQPNNNLDSTVSLSASINGAAWQTDTAYGYIVKYSGNDSTLANLEIIAVNYVSNPRSTITFNITNYSGPDTYKVNPPINTATYYKGSTRYFGTKGYIVITSDTAYALKGAFDFTADTLTISSGLFNVALPYTP